MLTESFIASTSSIQAAKDAAIATTLSSNQSSGAKDEGIFIHTFQPPQPGPAKQAFKKSSANSKCLAVSDTHIYAAQSGSAVIHVYKLENGVLEATVAFPERIACLELALDGYVVVLGLEGGGVILWETLTGRSIRVPHTHLQKVTAIATTEHLLLSGSADTSVHIWSIPDLLAFPSQESAFSSKVQSPRHTLTRHRSAITALATSPSPSATPSTSLAMSASSDGYVIAWDISTGTALRAFLLQTPPTALVLDPAERAAYAALSTGNVTMLDFYHTETTSQAPNTKNILSKDEEPPTDTLIQVPSNATWSSSNVDLGPALSITLSWDATTLLTSHADGAIAKWDVGRGTSAFGGIVTKLNGPATNVAFLPPTGFLGPQNSSRTIKQQAVTKPAPGGGRNGGMDDYKLCQISFPTTLPAPHFSAVESGVSKRKMDEFQNALTAPMFGEEVLEEGISELLALRAGESEGSGRGNKAVEEDFIMLDADEDAQTNGGPPELSLEQQNAQLRSQVKSLQGSLGTVFEEMKRRGWGRGKMGYGIPEVASSDEEEAG